MNTCVFDVVNSNQRKLLWVADCLEEFREVILESAEKINDLSGILHPREPDLDEGDEFISSIQLYCKNAKTTADILRKYDISREDKYDLIQDQILGVMEAALLDIKKDLVDLRKELRTDKKKRKVIRKELKTVEKKIRARIKDGSAFIKDIKAAHKKEQYMMKIARLPENEWKAYKGKKNRNFLIYTVSCICIFAAAFFSGITLIVLGNIAAPAILITASLLVISSPPFLRERFLRIF
tara:strand:- start:3 stop:716 length:714 start_codon:yes stop_codon:yes gene_type:complete